MSFRKAAPSRLILSEDERDLGFAYLITAGNEAVLNVADYLAELAVGRSRQGHPSIPGDLSRDPQKFPAAALKARSSGANASSPSSSDPARKVARWCKPIPVASQARTGCTTPYFKALASFCACAISTRCLETAVLLSKDTAALPMGGNVMVTLSGGEAALIADLGSESRIEIPQARGRDPCARSGPPSRRIPASAIPWTRGDWACNETASSIVLHALLDDPDINLIGFSIDAPGRGGGDVPLRLHHGAGLRRCEDQQADGVPQQHRRARASMPMCATSSIAAISPIYRGCGRRSRPSAMWRS